MFITFLAFLAGSGSAFYVSPRPTKGPPLLSSTNDDNVVTYFEDLVEAVECAAHYGKCDLAVLDELAVKVETGADDCTFEDGRDEAECNHEMNDRQAVANMLRLQAQLRKEMETLDNNLFVKDVRNEHDIRDRDMEMEILEEDGI